MGGYTEKEPEAKKSMGEKISVVIPVYKVEAYLAECLDSVISQTYRDMEIILVDDASPDGCGSICDRYAEKDSRIRVIHRSRNGGLAAARNTGIETATGEYLFFADSDDWLAEDTLQCLLENMKAYEADCCAGACVTVLQNEDGTLDYRPREHVPDHCETAHDAMKRLLMRESSACNRLYRREAFQSIRFPEGRINEDEPAVLRLYAQMERIVFLDRDTYFYRKRANSITTSAFSVKMVDCVYNSRDNLDFVTEKAPELIPAAQYKYCKTLLWCYVNLRKLRKDEQAKSLRRQLHREIRENRKMALSNPYLGFPMKVLTLFCML
ncbi:MAG: glycosyltransferase [Acetatifactor sp.]|nr:glycosyltransferase [Acetatifactor sp.]